MAFEGVFAVLPLLLMTAVGFGIAKRPWFGREGMSFLSKINMRVLIPVYMFSNVTKLYKSPGEVFELLETLPYPMLVIGSAMTMGILTAIPLRVRPPQRGVFINAVGLSNTVVMGMPVTLSLMGDVALPVVMLYYACNTICYWTAGVALLRRDAPGHVSKGVLASIWVAVTTPPLLAFLVGLLWVLAGLPVPGFAAATMLKIGECVSPMCMIFIGAVIRFADFRAAGKMHNLHILLPYKYLFSPFLAGFLCWLLPMSPFMKQVFFIQANMPAMAQLPIMAKEVGTDYEFASIVTALTTTISMATVPLYIFLMEYTGVFG